LTVKLKHKNLVMFSVIVLLTAGLGVFVYIHYVSPLVYNAWEQVIVQHGVVSLDIPVNTLYTEPNLPSPSSTNSSLLLTGTNRDTLYTVCVLDLSQGPEILSVPNMVARYYSIEFVDTRGDIFAYVGQRTTGTQAGNFLISGPGWHGTLPAGMTQISSPDNKVLLIGRVLVQNDADLSTAYSLSTQIQLAPLSSWQPTVG
jgi:hypothetical protein